MSKNECTEESFLNDVKDHSIIVYKDDGLYRHLRFSKVGTRIMYFDIITWPGSLCYIGDMGTYVFSRIEDMFVFFRSNNDELRIDTNYWSEKCDAVDKCSPIKEYSKERFAEVIKGYLNDYDAYDGLRDEVMENVLCYNENEYEAREAVRDYASEYDFEFEDFWERDLTEYTYRFIWCCYALVWGIKQYDKNNT